MLFLARASLSAICFSMEDLSYGYTKENSDPLGTTCYSPSDPGATIVVTKLYSNANKVEVYSSKTRWEGKLITTITTASQIIGVHAAPNEYLTIRMFSSGVSGIGINSFPPVTNVKHMGFINSKGTIKNKYNVVGNQCIFIGTNTDTTYNARTSKTVGSTTFELYSGKSATTIEPGANKFCSGAYAQYLMISSVTRIEQVVAEVECRTQSSDHNLFALGFFDGASNEQCFLKKLKEPDPANVSLIVGLAIGAFFLFFFVLFGFCCCFRRIKLKNHKSSSSSSSSSSKKKYKQQGYEQGQAYSQPVPYQGAPPPYQGAPPPYQVDPPPLAPPDPYQQPNYQYQSP